LSIYEDMFFCQKTEDHFSVLLDQLTDSTPLSYCMLVAEIFPLDDAKLLISVFFRVHSTLAASHTGLEFVCHFIP